jgi:hypothetical protein
MQEAGWAPGLVWTYPRTVQPVASRYTDRGIPAPIIIIIIIIIISIKSQKCVVHKSYLYFTYNTLLK